LLNTQRFLSATSFSPDTAEGSIAKSMCAASTADSQSAAFVYPHVLNRQKAGSFCLSLTTRALVTSNLSSKNNTIV
jgi:hypothetical protein